MNIEKLLSTRERIDILSHVVYKHDYISVSKVANDLGVSKGFVSKYLDLLAKEDIIKRFGGKFSVQDNVPAKAVKILLNLNAFDSDLFKGHKFVKGAGLFGSFVKGTNTEDSDIDLWLFIENAGEESLARLTSEIQKKFGNVKPLYLTREKILMLKKEDTVFFHSLIFGSVTVYGEGIEAV